MARSWLCRFIGHRWEPSDRFSKNTIQRRWRCTRCDAERYDGG